MISKTRTILVVEDSPDIMLLLKWLFQREGFVVHCATNGKNALDLLDGLENLPNSIVLDLMMPVMDGFQFREQQLKNERLAEIPIVVMSADGHVEHKSQQLGGVEFYVRKPVEIQKILSAVNSYCA
jgi:CheY-like chemotaxis protein